MGWYGLKKGDVRPRTAKKGLCKATAKPRKAKQGQGGQSQCKARQRVVFGGLAVSGV